MNCIIIDDEPLARAEMAALIRETSNLEIQAMFGGAQQALDFLQQHPVDLIFLDIEMPSVSGMALARQLPPDVLVIFTTAYPQYALDGYTVNALDYLLKPISKTRLETAIAKALKQFGLMRRGVASAITSEDFLMVKANRKLHKVPFQSIRFVEGLKDYVVLHCENQKLITSMNLKTIHEKMPQERFLRVSKSYVVNAEHIAAHNAQYIWIDQVEIRLGEVYKAAFFEAYPAATPAQKP